MLIGKKQELLLGPPGTGKTTTLIGRVDDYLKRHYKPEEIAFVSFTKKAVQEAADRACDKFKLRRSRLPLFQTVHSLCFRQLGLTRTNLLGKQNYIELGEWLGYDMSGQYDMGDGVLSTGAAPGDKFLFLDNIARVRCISVREVWEDEGFDVAWHELERFSNGYARYRERTGLLDFTDLLTKFVAEGHPTNAKVAFIDEAQDLSRAQWRVLQKCFAEVDEVIIAGDDDQSIYKWSGADLQTFLSLEGEKTILSQSHRLPKKIHAHSQRIISQVRNRYDKPFESMDKEGEIFHVNSLEQAVINPDETTLILARNVYLLPEAYNHVKRLGITYTGRNGYASVKQSHVQAIVAWEHMRKGNPISLTDTREVYEHLRIGDVLARGGKVKLDSHDETDETFTWETLRDHFGLLTRPVWHEALQGIPLEVREYYISVLRSKRKISAAPKVHINTIHGVKGGEADHVIILSDMSKRTFMEYQKDPDSEHRVFYVALTRSKDKVTIVVPRGKYAYML